MKKILLSVFAFAVMGIAAKVQAQCAIIQTNVAIQVVGAPIVLGPNKCQFTINTQFDMTSNAGFKYLFFHSWLEADYPSPAIFDCTGSTPAVNPGTSAELGTAVDDVGMSFLDYGFLDIVPGAVGEVQVLTFATTYLHDNTVVLTQPSNSPGITATRTLMPDGTYHFEISNIKIIVNQSCAQTLEASTDIWGSNSNANDPKAQCYICGTNNFFNDPTVTGFRNCANPRQYSVTISTADPVVKDITYKIYLDVNNNSIIDLGDVLAYTSPTIQISEPGGAAPDTYQSGLQTLPFPYAHTQPWSEMRYLVRVEGPDLANAIDQALLQPTCFILPVSFTSFTATRASSNVMLRWQTSTERNSLAFVVERNVSGVWSEVGTVPTQAVGGSSDDLLTYNFVDPNNVKGITQYRIRQVDVDTRSKYSEIRSVRGEGQDIKVTVYPNPTTDGKVNIAFDDSKGVRNVSVMDMSGRTVRQVNGITNNNITIENLMPGIYTIRVVVPETGAQTVEKIIVNKR